MTEQEKSMENIGNEKKKTDNTTGISWQSAMNPIPASTAEDAGAAPTPEEGEAAPSPAPVSEYTVPAEDSSPATKTPSTTGTASAFGSGGKDADALWASLVSDNPVKTDAPLSVKNGNMPEKLLNTKAPPAETVGTVANAEANTAGDFAENAGADVAGEGVANDETGKKTAREGVGKTGPFAGKSLGPVLPSLPMTASAGGALVPTAPTISSRIFTGFSFIPFLLPLALLVAQVLFTLDVRALWYSDEVRYANAYQNMVESGNWLVMHLNGSMYPDKPPLFFWFLYALNEGAPQVLSGGLPQPMLFFAGVAISGLLCLVACHLLASLVGRVDRRTVLAANLVLVGGFFFAGLLHYLRMDVLFTFFITMSHVFLFHAWVREKAPLLMLLGFLCAGSAVLVKGPLGFAFPLLAGLCFLAWQGRILRLFRLDALFGIIVGLAVPTVWLALAWMEMGDVFLDNILYKQVLARTLNTWHHLEPWYHYVMTLPLIWLPWTLVLLFLPWGRLFGKSMRAGIKASRTPEAAGIAYLWCAFLPGIILLSCVSIKLPIYCLPLFPPLAVLCARAILRMRPFAAACMQYSMAFLLALLGISFVLAPMIPKEILFVPVLPKGMMVLGGICLVFACMLAFLVKPRRTEGMLLLVALFTTAFAYPVWSIAAPSLDVFLSPKAQADVLKTYHNAGYHLATAKVYPGTYSYYAGKTQDFGKLEEALDATTKLPKVIIAMRAKDWDKLEEKPEGFYEVNRQTIAERDYVLVARPPFGQETELAVDKTPIPAPETPLTQEANPGQEAAPPTQEGAPPAVEEKSMLPIQEEAAPDSAPSVVGSSVSEPVAPGLGDVPKPEAVPHPPAVPAGEEPQPAQVPPTQPSLAQ